MTPIRGSVNPDPEQLYLFYPDQPDAPSCCADQGSSVPEQLYWYWSPITWSPDNTNNS